MRFHHELAHAGDHLCVVQLNADYEGFVRETSHPVFQVEAGHAQRRRLTAIF
ncbi:MAG TPA: hypothetical protein VF043_14210 [Ktedonobacteraceae bacterium]